MENILSINLGGGANVEGRRAIATTPISEGETYTVKIEGKGKNGDGLAKIEGFVVFVPETEIGQEVKIGINSVRRKFGIGKVIKN